MIPISDENPTRRTPIVTWAILITSVVVFLWELSFDEPQAEAVIRNLGFTPRDFFMRGFGPGAESGPWVTLVSSMFLHGSLVHLGGNMLYLWIFGNNVEDALGHVRFFVFYFVCGVAAALAQAVSDPETGIPMVGASGAISGILGAYVLIYPRARITVIIPFGLILFYPMKISAIFVVGFWFVAQLISAILADPGAPGVAWLAHVGGFVAGMLLTPLLSHYPLFGRHYRGPWG
jgi:membrane associated rhomboid family serine protease